MLSISIFTILCIRVEIHQKSRAHMCAFEKKITFGDHGHTAQQAEFWQFLRLYIAREKIKC